MDDRPLRQTTRGRRLTAQEAAHYRELRKKISAEAPQIIERGRKIRARADARRAAASPSATEAVPLQDTMVVLAQIRSEKGLSLTDINERTGMDRSVLSKLERREVANPTVDTLNRIASALGKRILVSVVDADS